MATKTEAQIKELFVPFLREGEEFRWIGEPRNNSSILDLLGFLDQIMTMLIMSLGFVMLGIALALAYSKGGGQILYLISGILGCSAIGFYVYQARKFERSQDHTNELIYYAVTNRRILIHKYGKLSDYPIRPLEDILIGKAKRGASSISLYYKKYPAGQYPKAICELNGIAEEEAQKAYEILRQARGVDFGRYQ